MISRRLRWFLAGAGILVLLFALGPWIMGTWWRARSSNPVRRGVQRAGELGCFTCHGVGGREGIPDPGDPDEGVPGWDGGVWMMYVKDDAELRNYILDGSPSSTVSSGASDRSRSAGKAITMPAYGDVLQGRDLEDLVAAFKVLAGMVKPPAGSPARRGRELAIQWDCLACHGAGGSGGLHNPGSFAGFVPGWYGPDFADLVRDRSEFDEWIREGSIQRLRNHFIASRYLESQRIAMPAYENMSPAELDDLWAYTRWLEDTDGGHQGDPAPF